jgi:redox-sensitive bicupin YhaK (pirin superfamily)
MITVRRAADRGHANHGWLDTYHTFSFASYQDPDQMGFRSLRVMNEDVVAPGKGFGTHPHQNMEIVTYVLSGALEHRDSMGNGQVLTPGELQRMSAGTGITHSEFNPSKTEPVHLYQIWLYPNRQNIEPSYEQKRFDAAQRENQLCLVASPDGREGSLRIHQEASILLGTLRRGHRIAHRIAAGRYGWLQVLRGSVTVDQETLQTSDGAAISGQPEVVVTAAEDAEVMFFELV